MITSMAIPDRRTTETDPAHPFVPAAGTMNRKTKIRELADRQAYAPKEKSPPQLKTIWQSSKLVLRAIVIWTTRETCRHSLSPRHSGQAACWFSRNADCKGEPRAVRHRTIQYARPLTRRGSLNQQTASPTEMSPTLEALRQPLQSPMSRRCYGRGVTHSAGRFALVSRRIRRIADLLEADTFAYFSRVSFDARTPNRRR
jgi:hypothetical protein